MPWYVIQIIFSTHSLRMPSLIGGQINKKTRSYLDQEDQRDTKHGQWQIEILTPAYCQSNGLVDKLFLRHSYSNLSCDSFPIWPFSHLVRNVKGKCKISMLVKCINQSQEKGHPAIYKALTRLKQQNMHPVELVILTVGRLQCYAVTQIMLFTFLLYNLRYKPQRTCSVLQPFIVIFEKRKNSQSAKQYHHTLFE